MAWAGKVHSNWGKHSVLLEMRVWTKGEVGLHSLWRRTQAVLGYNPISSRIITLRLSAHPVNITYVQVHAPAAHSSEEDIHELFEVVEEVLDKISEKDIVVLMGDWNAKMGCTCDITTIPENLDSGSGTTEENDNLNSACQMTWLLETPPEARKDQPVRAY